MPVSPYFIADIQLAASLLPETAVNTPYLTVPDFEGILVDSVVPYIPNLNIINDDDQVGDGTEFAKNPRPYNWTGSQVTLSSKLNAEFMARMMRRFLGGVVTDTLVAAGVYDHTIVMQLRTDRVPKLTTLIMLLGGADPLLSSMAVDKFTITQSRTDEPKGSVDLMGSGFHQRLSDTTGILGDISGLATTLPAPPAYHYFHGATLCVTASDGAPVDLTGQGLLSYQLALQQSIQWESLPCIDQFMVPGDVNSGAYMGVVFRGKRTLVPTLKLYLDSALNEYWWARNNTDITSMKFLTQGQKIGVTAYQYEFELNIPISKQSSLVIDTESDRGAKTVTFLPTKDPVSLGIVTARIRNGNATLT